jgi:hypothetical protein
MPGDRIPHSVLPPAEIGTAHTETTVTKLILVGIVAVMAVLSHLQVEALDKATAKQCRTHEWPQAAHQIHMDWCAKNNYPTN